MPGGRLTVREGFLPAPALCLEFACAAGNSVQQECQVAEQAVQLAAAAPRISIVTAGGYGLKGPQEPRKLLSHQAKPHLLQQRRTCPLRQ